MGRVATVLLMLKSIISMSGLEGDLNRSMQHLIYTTIEEDVENEAAN